MAEMAKLQAEEKEDEVTLLERSVEELECTVNVLENEVLILANLTYSFIYLSFNNIIFPTL